MKNNDGSYTAMDGAYSVPPAGYSYPAQAQYSGAYQPPSQYPVSQPYGGAYQPGPAYSDPYAGSQTAVLVKATSAEPVVESYSEMMDKHVRLGFIRKVYGIISAMLAFTFGLTFLFVYDLSVKKYVQTHPGVLIAAFVVEFATICALACSRNLARKTPHNYIVLAIFTCSIAYLVGACSSFYDTNVVLLAFGSTMVVTVALSLFACQTRVDFTLLNGSLYTLLWVLIMFGFMQIWFHNQILNTVYASLGAFIFSVYIIVDTQMLIGGKGRKIQFGPDDYVFAALNIFLDIINLFLYLLALFGKK